MELYILLAIIWLGGVIFSGLHRIVYTLTVSQTVTMRIHPTVAFARFLRDFFWFIYLPWVALNLLFEDD